MDTYCEKGEGNMKYLAYVFDFDYTLGDSTEGIEKCINYGLLRLGYPALSTDEVRPLVGLSLKETYKRAAKDDDEEKAAQFEAYFKEKADEVMTASTQYLPYAKEMLEKIHGMGIRTGIVTTKYGRRIREILKKCGGTDLIDVIIGGDDVDRPKPDPEGLLRMADLLNVSKEKILYIGDSIVDAKTAEQARIDFAGVTTGATLEEELSEYPHVAVYQDIRGLDEFLEVR